jgi:hypothetical protein
MDPNPPRTRPARQRGGSDAASAPGVQIRRPVRHPSRFEIPVSAIAPLFRARLARVFRCRVEFDLDVNARATARVLGAYYRSRRLVRIYANDRDDGRRPLEELFDTFLHEVAHHLEYTEPDSFSATACGRVPGRMHSRLFWRILGELKYRWICIQDRPADAESS